MRLGAQVGARWGRTYSPDSTPGPTQQRKQHLGRAWETALVKSPGQSTPRLPKTRELPQNGQSSYQRPQASLGIKSARQTVLGYAELQLEPCSHVLALLSGGPNPRKPSATSNLPRNISAPPGQANGEGRTAHWASSWRGHESQSRESSGQSMMLYFFICVVFTQERNSTFPHCYYSR